MIEAGGGRDFYKYNFNSIDLVIVTGIDGIYLSLKLTDIRNIGPGIKF